MQLFNRFFNRFAILILSLICITSCNDASNTPVQKAPDPIVLEVYKSPTCGCCELWVEHADANGFKSQVHHPDDLNTIKDKFGIAPEYQSCHTAVSPDGYIFEGHIPARLVKQFLNEKPAGAIGLAVPGMPLGSPGMEVGDRITPYDVVLLRKDGNHSVYARVTALEK